MKLHHIIEELKKIDKNYKLENCIFYFSGGHKSIVLMYALLKILKEKKEKMTVKMYIADRTSLNYLEYLNTLFEYLNAYDYFNIYVYNCGICNRTPNTKIDKPCPITHFYNKDYFNKEIIGIYAGAYKCNCHKNRYNNIFPLLNLQAYSYQVYKIYDKLEIPKPKFLPPHQCDKPPCPYYYHFLKKYYNYQEEEFYTKNGKDLRKAKNEIIYKLKIYKFRDYYNIKKQEFLQKARKNIFKQRILKK